MNQMITGSGANLVAASLSIALIVLGTIAGAVNGRLKTGLMCGTGLALLNLLLWVSYNAVVRSAGLDSVWAIAAMVILFAAIGAVIGLAAVKLERRTKNEER